MTKSDVSKYQKASLFVGRWQLFHAGHKALVESVLKNSKPVVIAIRDTPISGSDPYTVSERKEKILKELDKYKDLVSLVKIPDIDEICYGRQVGYRIRRIDLDEKLHAISGTKTRTNKNHIYWLTGNTGSGKSTLAFLLRERLSGVVLDGDEMRSSISTKSGFSKEDRDEHNLRVARLAKVLHRQRLNVIVAVIAPFASTRRKIEKIIKPKWIYVKRDIEPDENHPYEPPKRPDLVVDTDVFSIMECANQIWDYIKKVREGEK